MEEFDNQSSKVADPEERARKVWEFIQQSDFSTWDIVCFSIGYLGMILPVYPWLEDPTRLANRLIWQYHSMHAAEIEKWEHLEQESTKKKGVEHTTILNGKI